MSTSNVKFWHFVVATFLSLPKQLVVVYIGVLIGGGQSETLAKVLIFIVGFGFTAVTSFWIFKKLRTNKEILLREQEERKANRERERLELEDLSYDSQREYAPSEDQRRDYPQGEYQQREYAPSGDQQRYYPQAEYQQREYPQGGYSQVEYQQREYDGFREDRVGKTGISQVLPV
jgi:hypothetical protein